MKGRARRFLLRLARVASLALLAMVATVVLVRFAPGYFTDSREMDAQYASVAREQLQAEQQRDGTVSAAVRNELRGWMHADLGRSRHFDVPVAGLVRERARVTLKLLWSSIACGWLGALALALPMSVARTRAGEMIVSAPIAVLLATPIAALATACLISDFGGPVLVLSLLIGARDFQMVHRLLRHVLSAPYFLYLRAQGIATRRIVRSHLLPAVAPELLALGMSSFVLALSAAVPVEVIFDRPGLGQLAWNAAMNRDLPVLLAVTLLMALCVGVAGLFVDSRRSAEAAQCA
jgi:peptide/nickel transport system permease protein